MISSAFVIRGPIPVAVDALHLQPFYSWFSTHLTHSGQAFAIPVVQHYFAQMVALDVALEISTALETGFLLQVTGGPDMDAAKKLLVTIAREVHSRDPLKSTSLNEYRAMFGIEPLPEPEKKSIFGKVKGFFKTYL